MCCDALQTGWGKVDDMVIPVPNPQQLVSTYIYFTKIFIVMAGPPYDGQVCVDYSRFGNGLEEHYSMLIIAR